MTAEQESRHRHPLRDTAIAAIALGGLFSVYGMAAGLVFVAIAFAFWLPYSAFVMVRTPQRRRLQAIKVGIWLTMFATALAIHYVRHIHARNYADAVVQKIEQFRERQGRFPDKLEEIGVDPAELNNRLGLSNYSSRPRFYYANTIVAFHMWSYDFASREWVDEYD